uniref:Uncharacterized protein n=1 Tax=Arundo donax TaxID=35708 RepID=A0A0A9HU84_ARUDO
MQWDKEQAANLTEKPHSRASYS